MFDVCENWFEDNDIDVPNSYRQVRKVDTFAIHRNFKPRAHLFNNYCKCSCFAQFLGMTKKVPGNAGGCNLNAQNDVC